MDKKNVHFYFFDSLFQTKICNFLISSLSYFKNNIFHYFEFKETFKIYLFSLTNFSNSLMSISGSWTCDSQKYLQKAQTNSQSELYQ